MTRLRADKDRDLARCKCSTRVNLGIFGYGWHLARPLEQGVKLQH